MVARIVVVCGGVDITGPLAQFLHISGPKCPIPPSKPPSPTAGAGAQKRKAEDLLEADTVARGRHGTALATQGAAEYELIWLLQQRLRAVSWPHWRLRCMQPSLLTHGMGVVRP